MSADDVCETSTVSQLPGTNQILCRELMLRQQMAQSGNLHQDSYFSQHLPLYGIEECIRSMQKAIQLVIMVF